MINISFSVSKIVPAVPKLQLLQRIDARMKYLIYLLIVLYFAPICIRIKQPNK